MNEKDLQILEFPKIREMVAGFTAFPPSRALALELRPSSDYDLICQQLSQSAEARRLLSLQPNFSIGEASDVREIVRLATRGGILEPQSLVHIQVTLAASRHIRTSLRKLAKELPLLCSIADRIVELAYLEEEIGKSVSTKGEVLDSASTLLTDLRLQEKEVRQQLMDRLQSIIESPKGRRCLQDTFITEREGRYVIPVKIEFRREMGGIVHDISNTEATAFVEPWATVELGNELREVTAEEKREVERILRALSAEVGVQEAAISSNVELVAELDVALAKARFARRAGATEPQIAPAIASGKEGSGTRVLRFVDARHPLLGGEAVPLSVEIGDDYSALVVTGPNTGGKTVALKTIGLLTVMAQAGIPIPASEKTRLPVFDSVFADIGDEQSIEQTLSTFSWHISNIVRILRSSGERSLVLLDELGTSTDPNEGAALAQAILLHCLSRETMVVATTHFSELKGFAHATPGMRNASLDFDPVTLAPTYHLTMGIPGGSNALAMAAQLGLPPEIIDSARRRLAKGTQDIEALLADLQGEKQRIEGLRIDLEREKKEAEETKGHWEGELQKLRQQEQNLVSETINRLAEETSELQIEIRQAVSELKKARSRENLQQAENTLSSVQDKMTTLTSQVETIRANMTGDAAEAGKIGVGDRVWLKDMKKWGTVLSLREGEGQVEVQVGRSKIITGSWTIEKAKQPGAEVPSEPSRVRQRVTRATSLELDLRGKRADDVAPELDRYLNDASLAALTQVRIIHGFGTGTVRQIVREALSTHPLVKSFRPGSKEEGGDGVTMVNL